MRSDKSRRDLEALDKLKRRAQAENPRVEFDVTPQGLLQPGPVILAHVGVTAAHEKALLAASLPVPPRVPCRFLIDTGADGCMIKHEIAERAGLKLINSGVPMHGVGVDTTGRVYIGRIVFVIQSERLSGVEHEIAANTEITSGSLMDSKVIDGLLGRNMLASTELIYNGVTGKVSLKFTR
ncbi:MAG: retropepsin-like domain-containing protein [Acidobacteria bacterium]|nr:retropepsin-like domain-containing protein [Acidobacteriota bacterium]